MDRKRLDYLPPVLREVMEMQAINEANEPEIAIAWDALALVLANQFLEKLDDFDFSFPRSIDKRQLLSKYRMRFIDEIGYLPMYIQGANLFFQLIARRYEKTVAVFTSNKTFSQWNADFKSHAIRRAVDGKLDTLSGIMKNITAIYTNPMFQDIKGMDGGLKEHLRTYFPDAKCDLCAAKNGQKPAKSWAGILPVQLFAGFPGNLGSLLQRSV